MYRTYTQQTTAEIGAALSTSPAEDMLSCPLPDLYTRLHTSAERLSDSDIRSAHLSDYQRSARERAGGL